MSSNKDRLLKLGDDAFSKIEKVNSELLMLTYGSLITQLIKDSGDVEVVNKQLDKIGYNIGVRIVDEFLAKSGVMGGCASFRETANLIAKVAFKMFLGVSGEVSNWNTAETCCSLILPSNPLTTFVELPAPLHNLNYSNVYCGVIRGALQQLNMKVSCSFLRDTLKGDDVCEIRLDLLEILRDDFIDDEDA